MWTVKIKSILNDIYKNNFTVVVELISTQKKHRFVGVPKHHVGAVQHRKLFLSTECWSHVALHVRRASPGLVQEQWINSLERLLNERAGISIVVFSCEKTYFGRLVTGSKVRANIWWYACTVSYISHYISEPITPSSILPPGIEGLIKLATKSSFQTGLTIIFVDHLTTWIAEVCGCGFGLCWAKWMGRAPQAYFPFIVTWHPFKGFDSKPMQMASLSLIRMFIEVRWAS